MAASKNSIPRDQDLSWLFPLLHVCVSYLALVKVIDNLLVELVLELPLSGGLVAVSLGQVGRALLVRPLREDKLALGSTLCNTIQSNRGNKWQEINHWVIANANGRDWCVTLFTAAPHSDGNLRPVDENSRQYTLNATERAVMLFTDVCSWHLLLHC